MRCCRGDRETESSQFVRAGVCGAPRLSGVPSLRLSLLLGLIAEAVYYLWLDRAGLCRAERSGGSGQKAAAQVVPPSSSSSCHSTSAPAGGEGRTGTHSRCCPRKCAGTSLPVRSRAHTSTPLGHQRSCHRVILPGTESKDILDSGSKSQRANENSGRAAAF